MGKRNSRDKAAFDSYLQSLLRTPPDEKPKKLLVRKASCHTGVVKVDKQQFDAVLQKLLKAPPLPKAEIPPKRAPRPKKAAPAKARKK